MIELSQLDYEPLWNSFGALPEMTCKSYSGTGKSKVYLNCYSNTTQCSYYQTYYASNFSNIVVTIDGQTYTIPSSAYLVDGTANNYTQYCTVMIQQTTVGSAGIVLGTPFLK